MVARLTCGNRVEGRELSRSRGGNQGIGGVAESSGAAQGGYSGNNACVNCWCISYAVGDQLRRLVASCTHVKAPTLLE